MQRLVLKLKTKRTGFLFVHLRLFISSMLLDRILSIIYQTIVRYYSFRSWPACTFPYLTHLRRPVTRLYSPVTRCSIMIKVTATVWALTCSVTHVLNSVPMQQRSSVSLLSLRWKYTFMNNVFIAIIIIEWVLFMLHFRKLVYNSLRRKQLYIFFLNIN